MTVFYDGICNLCHSWVKILKRLDTQHRLNYQALQGEYSQSLGIDTEIKSIILYDKKNHIFYKKSTAILKLCHHLGGMCKLMALFYLVPRIIRDFIYDRVAKYRYRIFGKRDTCDSWTR